MRRMSYNKVARMNIRFSIATMSLALLGGFVLTGCGGGTSDTPAPAPQAAGGSTATASATGGSLPSDFKLNVDSGAGITQSTDPKQLQNLVASIASSQHSRQDPFALNSTEQNFDATQLAQRITSQDGDFEMFYQPPPDTSGNEEPVQEQPYRRLSGVLVGDSVLGIIDMGDGSAPQIIRPGQEIGDTGWTVVSISQTEAVLHRGGKVLPHDVTVRLEQAPAGMGGGSGVAGGAQGGPAGVPTGGPSAPGAKGLGGGPSSN